MGPRLKLTGEERKRRIVIAARDAFAKNGYSATSLKELAKVAGVSEALLYKHFASKEALYSEVLEFGVDLLGRTRVEMERIGPSTEALVICVYNLMHLILFEVPAFAAEQRAFEKLLFRSLIGDRKLAMHHFESIEKPLTDNFITSCFKAAAEAGDLVELPMEVGNRMWFVHHLAMALNLCHLSGPSVFHYDAPKWQLVEQAVLFCLRGIGLTDEAIRKHYHPEQLRLILRRVST